MTWANRALWVAVLLGLVVALLGCGPAGTATPSPGATATSAGTAVAPAAGTATAAPTATSPPTATTAPTPTARPTATTAGAAGCAVGQRCERNGVALTVNGVETTDTIDAFPTAAPGNTFLVTDVSIENASQNSEPYNPLYFKVRATDGTEFNTTMVAPSPSLKSGDLAPGDRVRGNVAFEMPQNAQGLVLLYQPITFPQPEVIRVDLGR